MRETNEDIQPAAGEAASGCLPSGTAVPTEATTDDALRYALTRLTQAPDHPEGLLLMGTIHTWRKQFEQAVPFLQRAKTLMPDNAEAFNTLGLALHESGRTEEAISSFRKAIDLRPSFPDARARLRQALAARGHTTDNIEQYRAVLAIEARMEAIARHRAALAADPQDMAALTGLGHALHAAGRHEEAAEPFRTALTHTPACPDAARNLAQALVALNRLDEAIACYRSVLEQDPSLHAIHAATGTLLRKAGRHAEAIHHLEQAHALRPDDAPIHAALAQLLQEQGHIDAAIAHRRRAIALAPEEPSHYLALARLTKLAPDDPALAAMHALAGREETLDDRGRMTLHFALGKALADLGRNQESFDHLLKANAIRRRLVPYDEKPVARAAKAVREHFTAEALAATAGTGHPSSRPIFIVGMPRSGSTLVEQILASHPDVYGAGEVSTLTDTLKDAAKRFPTWQVGTPLACLSAQDRHAIAEEYLQRLDKLAAIDWTGDHPPARITNKMLDNFFHIGIIRQLWPNARIIHTCRDPIDTCLSCFSISFDNLDFTFDLGELGRYHRQYQQQMAHWRQVLPADAILDVHYEDIVEDLEANARRIIAWCGLPWNDACLRFHETRRLVRTSSVAQVRKPLYRTAVGRWRPDNETLRPLLEALGTGIPKTDCN
ncbi:tetratricopeptide repeat protein [Gluconacetobacter sp. 1b LMG 1731]|uniref:Tetratricopeptide repeat protein n=1 Tax=Gluconacetobacter dulcium TaxID=2729096 RepID=A0A7W4NUP3_9PROT|nr:tetratricopeptide repeat-containing sulfotransferase family protein [Gluconacetobacter dulcium]MBB2164443.1 tetratricopeptide repeat protein [Gluconacetobacter dulcium]MBB2193487.1 tetratricopeptide repeat protein [Gluconacetobacter dulcium]